MTNVYSGLFVDFTASPWYLQLLPRSCVDWLSLVYRTLPLFLHALFAGSCRKGFVPLITVLAVPCHEGRVLLDFDYQFLLCRLWTVDIFLLAFFLYGLYQLFSSIPSCKPAQYLDILFLRYADLPLSGSSFALCLHV